MGPIHMAEQSADLLRGTYDSGTYDSGTYDSGTYDNTAMTGHRQVVSHSAARSRVFALHD